MSGIGVHPGDLAQRLAGGGVTDGHAQQLRIKAGALRQLGVCPADIQVLTLQGQGRVHIIHAGELHQHQGLVDVVGSGGDGGPVQIERLELGQEGRVLAVRLYPHLAPDAVGVDDAADFDGFQSHRSAPLGSDGTPGRLRPGQEAGGPRTLLPDNVYWLVSVSALPRAEAGNREMVPLSLRYRSRDSRMGRPNRPTMPNR